LNQNSVLGLTDTSDKQIQNLTDLHSSYVPVVSAQVEFCASRNWVHVWSNIYIYIYVYISVEIQPPTHWDLIGRSMTVLRSLLASSLPVLPFCHLRLFCASRKTSARF